MLPKEKIFPNLIPHFPTRWQAVVFRNYGIVPVARIAAALSASEAQIHESAAQMGLSPLRGETDFCTEAYLTVLRANWHLLNYEQLMLLMDISEQKLNAYLYEDDFCSVKLGDKPKLERVVYAPLTPEQRSRTQKIGQTVANYAKAYAEPPFAFRTRFSCAPYENEGISVSYPDGCEDYVDFWRHYYELSYFQGKKIVCNIEKTRIGKKRTLPSRGMEILSLSSRHKMRGCCAVYNI